MLFCLVNASCEPGLVAAVAMALAVLSAPYWAPAAVLLAALAAAWTFGKRKVRRLA